MVSSPRTGGQTARARIVPIGARASPPRDGGRATVGRRSLLPTAGPGGLPAAMTGRSPIGRFPVVLLLALLSACGNDFLWVETINPPSTTTTSTSTTTTTRPRPTTTTRPATTST